MLSHKESAFMAPAMVREGIAVVSVNYTLVGEGASITEIVRQCRAAVSWTFKNARDFGANPDRLFVGGSSAGGHLTGMTVAGGWHDQFGIPTDIIKGRGSPQWTARSSTDTIITVLTNGPNSTIAPEAAQNSPVLHLPSTGCPPWSYPTARQKLLSSNGRVRYLLMRGLQKAGMPKYSSTRTATTSTLSSDPATLVAFWVAKFSL